MSWFEIILVSLGLMAAGMGGHAVGFGRGRRSGWLAAWKAQADHDEERMRRLARQHVADQKEKK